MPTSGPNAGKCCVPPPPTHYQCLGSEETLANLPVYITGSRTSPTAVLMICDIYGWKVPQTRLLADKIAAEGHFVVLPDFLHGDFFHSPNLDDPYEGLPDYLARHSQPRAIEEANQIIAEIKSLGIKHVGVAGFCWGGKITVSLLKVDNVSAAVMCHPSFLLMDEIKAVEVPLTILGAEIDEITPPEMALEFGAALAKSPEIGEKSNVKIFPGADHGWTTRYDPDDEAAAKRAEEAHQDLLAWFHKYLI